MDNLDLNDNEKLVTIVSLQLMRLNDIKDILEHYHLFKKEYNINPDILSMYFHFIKHTANVSSFQNTELQQLFKNFLNDLNNLLVSGEITSTITDDNSNSKLFEMKHISILISMIIQLHTNNILQLDINTMTNTLSWLESAMHTIEYKHIPMIGIFILQCKDCDNYHSGIQTFINECLNTDKLMKLVPNEIVQILMFLSALDVEELEDHDVILDLEDIVETLCDRLLMRKSDIDNNL